jgi:hypothetical protein
MNLTGGTVSTLECANDLRGLEHASGEKMPTRLVFVVAFTHAVYLFSKEEKISFERIFPLLLRRAAERTIPRLLRKIRSLLRAVSPDECLNFASRHFIWIAGL